MHFVSCYGIRAIRAKKILPRATTGHQKYGPGRVGPLKNHGPRAKFRVGLWPDPDLAFRSPDHKIFFFSFILGCPQDFHFARPFWYGWVETGLNGQNSRAKLKSGGHPRIKLKKCFVVRRPKSFIENCCKKIDS